MATLNLEQFKLKTAPTGGSAGLLDLNAFKLQKEPGFLGKTFQTAKEEVKKGGENLAGTAERFGEAVKGRDFIRAGAEAFATPMRLAGPTARVFYSPISTAIGEAIEGISNMKSVERIAMSDKVSKILDFTKDATIPLSDAAKRNPQLTSDIKDFVDTIALALSVKSLHKSGKKLGVDGGGGGALPKTGSTEQLLEAHEGWKPGTRVQFDTALRGGDKAAVQKLLPDVPDVYKTRFANEIDDVIRTRVPVQDAGPLLSALKNAKQQGDRAFRSGISIVEQEADDILRAPVREGSFRPKVAATFKKYGIEPPISAVTTSRAIQGAEGILQSSWIGGSKITKIVEDAQSGISKVADSLRKYADPDALIKPGVTLENVGKDLKDALTKTKASFDNAKTALYDDATKRIGKQQAILNETRNALDDIIARKSKSADPGAAAEIKYYQDLRNNLSTAEVRTFENVKATRSDIGRKLQNRTDPITVGDKATISRLYAALSKDLDATVIASGANAANALKLADAFYKAGIEKINSFVGRTIKNSRSPEKIFGSLVKGGDVTMLRDLKAIVGADAFQSVSDAFMNSVVISSIVQITGKLNPSKLAGILAKYGDDMIRELVGERGLKQLKDLLRSSIADDIIEKATLDGRVQPGRLVQAIEKYDDKILRQVFSPEDYVKLMDLKTMAQSMAKGTKIVAGSPTAEKLQLGMNVTLGAVNVPSLLTKMGIEWGLTKLFTTPWGRKLLTRGGLKSGEIRGVGGAKGGKGGVSTVSDANAQPRAPQRVTGGQSVSRYTEQAEAKKNFPRDLDLSKEDLVIQEKAIEKWFGNKQKLVNEYIEKNGKVANVDEARKLFKDVGYKGSNAVAVQEVASDLIKEVWQRILHENKGDFALIYAGGSGSGKSSAIKALIPNEIIDAAAILDGNLSKMKSAIDRIAEAEKAGKTLIIPYAFRNPVESFVQGVVKRQLKNVSEGGRIVPTKVVAENHVGSWKVINELIDKGKNTVLLINNNLGAGKARFMSVADFKNIKFVDNLKELLNKEIKKIYDAGTITKEQYEAYIR